MIISLPEKNITSQKIENQLLFKALTLSPLLCPPMLHFSFPRLFSSNFFLRQGNECERYFTNLKRHQKQGETFFATNLRDYVSDLFSFHAFDFTEIKGSSVCAISPAEEVVHLKLKTKLRFFSRKNNLRKVHSFRAES